MATIKFFTKAFLLMQAAQAEHQRMVEAALNAQPIITRAKGNKEQVISFLVRNGEITKNELKILSDMGSLWTTNMYDCNLQFTLEEGRTGYFGTRTYYPQPLEK